VDELEEQIGDIDVEDVKADIEDIYDEIEELEEWREQLSSVIGGS
jgi:archaellum component FlaC